MKTASMPSSNRVYARRTAGSGRKERPLLRRRSVQRRLVLHRRQHRHQRRRQPGRQIRDDAPPGLQRGSRQPDRAHRQPRRAPAETVDRLFPGPAGHRLRRDPGHHHQATLKLLPKPKYALDLLAIFDDRRQAMGVVTKIIKAGITPTCVEFMDNITIKSVEKYLNENLQGSDNGNYVIVEVEGTSEDDLDDKAVILDEVCTENGASQSSSLTTIRSGRPARPLPKPSAPKASSSAKKTSSSLSTRKRPSSMKSCAWPRNTTWSHVSPATPATATFT